MGVVSERHHHDISCSKSKVEFPSKIGISSVGLPSKCCFVIFYAWCFGVSKLAILYDEFAGAICIPTSAYLFSVKFYPFVATVTV